MSSCAEPKCEISAKAAPFAARRGRRWRYALLAAALALAAAFVFRAPLLRGVAGFLDVGEPVRAADFAVVMRNDVTLAEILGLYREGLAANIVLLDNPPHRIERHGIVPTSTEVVRRALIARGVPAERVQLVPIPEGTGWIDVRELGVWLSGRPEAQVTALMPQFEARDYRHRLTAALPADVRARIRLHSVPHPWFDTSNWWQRKEGILHLCTAYLRLAFDLCHGEEEEPRRKVDFEEYKRTLR